MKNLRVVQPRKGSNNMALTDAQKRAKAKYSREKVTKVTIEFYPSEAELLKKLQEQSNKQGYIKELIRKDLK